MESRGRAHHLLVTHSIQRRPTTHFQYRRLCPHSSLFQFPHLCLFSHRPSHFLFFKTTHCRNLLFVSHIPKMNLFLPLSCAMATNNRKKQECLRLKICRGFRYPTPLLHYYSAGNGWLLPNAEAEVCLSASMLTPMCFLGQ